MLTDLEFRTEPTVRLIDSMGDDGRIAWAARGSTGGGNVNPDRDNGLVATLIREGHTVPIEHTAMTWEIDTSVTVARQLVKYRLSSWSELSGRYREIPGIFYLPHPDRPLGQKGKPMDYDMVHLDKLMLEETHNRIREVCEFAWYIYNLELRSGKTREVARSVLPECRGTNIRWTMNLHTALHIMQQRIDWRAVDPSAFIMRGSHPQFEVQQVALLMWDQLVGRWPQACESFRESGYSL